MESPCECGFEPPGFIKHGVSYSGSLKKLRFSGIDCSCIHHYEGPFINYVRVPRRELKKSLYTLTFGRGQNHSYVIFSKSIFILEIVRSSGLARIIFHLRLEGKKRIKMSGFSVTDPFLTTFYYVEKQNGILCKNRGLKNLTCLYMEVGGSKITKIILTYLMNGSIYFENILPQSDLNPRTLVSGQVRLLIPTSSLFKVG